MYSVDSVKCLLMFMLDVKRDKIKEITYRSREWRQARCQDPTMRNKVKYVT